MGKSDLPSPAVIVGIDGSSDGIQAALWAVDEAVGRDIPLRLVYVACPANGRGAAELDTAELAIRQMVTAVESTDKPVKIEVEALRGRFTDALLEASESAALICLPSPVAAATRHSAGATMASLVASAQCPVTLVRSHPTTSGRPGWIVVWLDESPAGDRVLERGLEEARLRKAPLRVLTTSGLRFTDVHDTGAVAGRNRWAKACLDHRLAPWRDRYPDVQMKGVAVQGNALNYLVEHLDAIQLVIAGGERLDGLGELLNPPGSAAIGDTDCSVMICEMT